MNELRTHYGLESVAGAKSVVRRGKRCKMKRIRIFLGKLHPEYQKEADTKS